jgi:hypothetical protein
MKQKAVPTKKVKTTIKYRTLERMYRGLQLFSFGVLVAAVGLTVWHVAYGQVLAQGETRPAPTAAAKPPAPVDPNHITADDVTAIKKLLSCPAYPEGGLQYGQLMLRNSIEMYRSVQSCYAESDFTLTSDNKLIASHDPTLPGGSCPLIRSATLEYLLKHCTLPDGEHPTTLEDFLSMPLTEYYIDLKPTMGNGPDTLQAITQTIAVVKAMKRETSTVIMNYSADPAVAQLLLSSGIRSSFKSYPTNDTEAKYIIDITKKLGYTMLNMRVDMFAGSVIRHAYLEGISLLGWNAHETLTDDGHAPPVPLGRSVDRMFYADTVVLSQYQHPGNVSGAPATGSYPKRTLGASTTYLP